MTETPWLLVAACAVVAAQAVVVGLVLGGMITAIVCFLVAVAWASVGLLLCLGDRWRA